MKTSGFTLLEVLVALAVLSSVALLVIRATGEEIARAADNGWRDLAVDLGRKRLVELARSGFNGSGQGTFAPEYPDISWKAGCRQIDDKGTRLLTITVFRGKNDVVLEKVLAP